MPMVRAVLGAIAASCRQQHQLFNQKFQLGTDLMPAELSNKEYVLQSLQHL